MLLSAPTNCVLELPLLAANLIVKIVLPIVMLAIHLMVVLGVLLLKNALMQVLLVVLSKEPVKLAISPRHVTLALQVLFVYGVKILLLANNLELIVSLLTLAMFSAILSETAKLATWFLVADGVTMTRNAWMLTLQIVSLLIHAEMNQLEENADLIKLLL